MQLIEWEKIMHVSFQRSVLTCAVKISLFLFILLAFLAFQQSPSLSVNFVSWWVLDTWASIMFCHMSRFAFASAVQHRSWNYLGPCPGILPGMSKTCGGFFVVVAFLIYSVWDVCLVFSLLCYFWGFSMDFCKNKLICTCTFSGVRWAQREITLKLAKIFFIHKHFDTFHIRS